MALYDAAVGAADPSPLTKDALHALALGGGRRIRLFSLGKAAQAMAVAAVDALRDCQCELAGGVIVAAQGASSPDPNVVALRGDHPVPGPRSVLAAGAVADQAAAVGDDEIALVLLSGGATSLIAAPIAGVAERDLVRLFDLLHRAGLDVHAMNVVRKRFTQWGAGRLAVALAPARTCVLAISDVPGDDPADLASGPCEHDVSTAGDVIALLRDATLLAELPPGLRKHLEAVRRGNAPETPKPSHHAFSGVTTSIIGSNRMAVAAALARARDLGVDAEPGGEPLTGDAVRWGSRVADALITRAERGWAGCVVWGGETTVHRPASAVDSPPPGLGGRCQELALAAARQLSTGAGGAQRITILAAGTDGRDGPTDAAGAFADATVWSTAARHGRSGEEALARHDSYSALDAAGALFRRGPTGTNVMDIVIGVVR